MTGRTYLRLEDVLVLHAILLRRFGGESGVLSLASLESAIARPQSGYYENLLEEGCALFQSLWTNHAFVDGNKRVAYAALDAFLRINGFRLRQGASNPFNKFLEHNDELCDFGSLVGLLNKSVEAR